MRVGLLSLLALFAAAFAAPTAVAPAAMAETVNVNDVVRQEARTVVRRVCRPFRRCVTRYRNHRQRVIRTVCRRHKVGKGWRRTCVRRTVYRVVRRPVRICRASRRCVTRRVTVR